MSNGTVIAAEISAALGEAAQATGDGKLTVWLSRDGVTNETTYPPTPAPDALYSFGAVISGFNALDRAGGNVQIGDVKLMLDAVALDADGNPAPGIVPTAADKLVTAGVEYSVVNVRTVKPGGVVLYHEVQARG